MIKKLKTKFIILCMASLFVLLSVIVVGMNVITYRSMVEEADSVLEVLSQNKGKFPEMEGGKENQLPRNMSPEIPYESRYFSVLYNKSGEIIETDTSNIKSVDSEEAEIYAEEAVMKDQDNGFVGEFRYRKCEDKNSHRIIFLDCGRKINTFETFLVASIGMALIGFIIVFIVVFFCSGRIIRPLAESYEKQKRFITDAGHEIKTPLTIINANVDLLKMELEENECLTDIEQQTKRLTSLTNDLVYLARIEEAEDSLQMIEFPVSEIVYDMANSFKALAQTQEKEFACYIQPLLSMRGNDKSVEQLVSILLDNGLKYSPKGGKISVELVGKKKAICLSVSNTVEHTLQDQDINNVFDRFYRIDKSRNSETGGHGIGLSVAKAIVEAHGGRILASLKEEQIFEIVVTLPI